MTNLPQVTVQWHGGQNEYGQYDVAVQNTIKEVIEAMPVGTEFSLVDLRAHVDQAVRQDIATKPDPDEYNPYFDYKTEGITFVASYWTMNPRRRRENQQGMLLEWIDESAVLSGEISEEVAQYRRI